MANQRQEGNSQFQSREHFWTEIRCIFVCSSVKNIINIFGLFSQNWKPMFLNPHFCNTLDYGWSQSWQTFIVFLNLTCLPELIYLSFLAFIQPITALVCFWVMGGWQHTKQHLLLYTHCSQNTDQQREREREKEGKHGELATECRTVSKGWQVVMKERTKLME